MAYCPPVHRLLAIALYIDGGAEGVCYNSKVVARRLDEILDAELAKTFPGVNTTETTINVTAHATQAAIKAANRSSVSDARTKMYLHSLTTIRIS